MTDLKEIILELINEIEAKEKIVNVKGGRGGGPGSAYPEGTVGVLKKLGYEHGEKEKEYHLKPVKISKAFKGNKNDN